jgi:GGDEF domain-containing protein
MRRANDSGERALLLVGGRLALALALTVVFAAVGFSTTVASQDVGRSAPLHEVPCEPGTALASAELGGWGAAGALGALGFGLLLASGVLLRVWRRKRSSAQEDELRQKQVSDALEVIRSNLESLERSAAPAPRTLAHSPFGAEGALESQIEAAAEACVRMSRTIGLIYFEVPFYAEIENKKGKAQAYAALSALADVMRRYLRATDHVEALGGDQIVVCVCLLEKAADLKSVAKRLSTIVDRHEAGGEGGAEVRPGLAIYPLDGSSGAELIAAARRSYRAQAEPSRA